MILFTVLLIFAIVLAVVTICAIIAGGVTMVIAFGDVIVCIGLIVLILRHIWKKKFR